MPRTRRAVACALAGGVLVSMLVGCTKTAAPAAPSPTPSPTPSGWLVASASPQPGPGDFSDGDN